MRPLLLAAALLAAAACTATPPGGDAPPRPPRPSSTAPSWTPPAAPASSTVAAAQEPPPEPPPEDPAAQRARIIAEFSGRRPRAWGLTIAGVMTHVTASDPVIALTFDACGGPGGDGYDAALIDGLRRERVPATLFLTSRWINAHRTTAAALAQDPLFDIENHGSAHRPCSVTGRSAYDIRGTRDPGDAADEIQRGARAILELTGRAPRFYRPGTAYFDDVCLDIVGALGERAAGFAVNGDGGAGHTRRQVKDALLKAPPGAIILLHMNHPTGATAEGVMDAVPILKARGVRFTQLRGATGDHSHTPTR